MQRSDYTARTTLNVTTNSVVKIPGNWSLVAIVVNTRGASSNIAKIYDDAGAPTPSQLKGTLDTTNVVGDVQYQMPMFNGIYIVISGGTPPDLTIVYEPLK